MPDLSIKSSMPTPVKSIIDIEAGFAWHAVAESATWLVFTATEDAWTEWYSQRWGMPGRSGIIDGHRSPGNDGMTSLDVRLLPRPIVLAHKRRDRSYRGQG